MKFIKYIFYPIMLLVFWGCPSDKEDSMYPLHVGDIEFDGNMDNPDFFICNENRIPQYYAFEISPYKGEKPAIEKYYLEKYSSEGLQGENGYLTIRFIVNCKGEAGRFRMQEMDLDMNEQKFNLKLSEQLFILTKELDGWNDFIHKKQPYDYYNYITFKIINGEINEILP